MNHGSARLGTFGPVAKSQAVGVPDLDRSGLAFHIRNNLLHGDVLVSGIALRLEPLAPSIGTIVHGLDLAKPLDPGTLSFLKNLWLSRKVIFFRGQKHLTRQQHVKLAEQFGVVGSHHGERDWIPDFGKDGVLIKDCPDMAYLLSTEDAPSAAESWHSDVMWSTRPPMGSLLICRTCPPVGGDTCFCDGYAMWEGLRANTRARLEGLSGLNVGGPGHKFRGTTPYAIHPCVRTHPETGGNVLYVAPGFTRKILGVSEEDSQALLRECAQQAGRQEYVCRFRWEEGSIALWDNRAVFHKAVADFWPHKRYMERLTVLDQVEASKVPYFDSARAKL